MANYTTRERNQRLNLAASTGTLYADASARSGRATNFRHHVGVTMMACTFVGQTMAGERGGRVVGGEGLMVKRG